MILIEDLGMQYSTENSKVQKRFGVYECPICKKPFRCLTESVKSGKTTKCRKCADRLRANSDIEKAANRFIDKAVVIHNNKYSYTLFNYLGNKVKACILCKVHGEFWQTPSNHLNGYGCPKCGALLFNNIATRRTISSGKPTTLYYIYLPEHNLWKIGCTERDIEARFKDDKTYIEILGVKIYDDSREAYFVEGWVLRVTKGAIVNEKILKAGNSELRSEPIPNLLDLVKEAEASFKG